jgi:hypothetical protein
MKKITTISTLIAFGIMSLPGFTYAALDSATIVSSSITLTNDADSNGIINVGDNITVDVVVNNDSSTTAVSGDTTAYGGSASESFVLINDNAGVGDEFQLVMTVVDADSSGIDVAANDFASVIDLSYSDSDEANVALGPTLTTDVVVDSIAPDAVTNLSASADSNSIDLSWAASSSSDAEDYDVLRSNTSGSGYVEIATNVTGTSFEDTAITDGTIYYYVLVTEDDADNESGLSAEVSATAALTNSGGGASLSAFNANNQDQGDNMEDDDTEDSDQRSDEEFSDEAEVTSENDVDTNSSVVSLIRVVLQSNLEVSTKVTLLRVLLLQL